MNAVTGWYSSAAVALLATAGLNTNLALANPHPAPAPYVEHADLLKWLSDGDRGLWVQASDLRWFYAGLAGTCHGLQSTNSVHFDTGGSSRIDHTSSVIVPGGPRCRVRSFVPSNGPPRDRNKDVALQPQTQ
jgi:uncharacterized protein DUF6491